MTLNMCMYLYSMHALSCATLRLCCDTPVHDNVGRVNESVKTITVIPVAIKPVHVLNQPFDKRPVLASYIVHGPRTYGILNMPKHVATY